MNADLIRVRNYAGPIAITFGSSGGDGGDTPLRYVIYIATFSLTETTTDQASANSDITAISWYMTSNTTYYFTDAVDGETYYVKIAVRDDDNEWSALSTEDFDTSFWSGTRATNTSVTGVDTIGGVYVINFDSQTATITFTITDTNGGPAYPEKVNVDIQKPGGTTILSGVYEITSFTLTDAGATFSIDWDGGWSANNIDEKHLGTYTVEATPVGYDGTMGTMGSIAITFDAVHVNGGVFNYTTGGSDMTCYGPPFTLDYYLSKNSFVMWRIYDRNQTETTTDDTLIRVMVSSAPRVRGDTLPPYSINDMINNEVWDGRDNNGAIVSNDIYRFEFQAYEFWGEAGSGFVEESTDRSTIISGLITNDVLRIVDLKTTGITASGGLASIGYYLGGANTEQGGANVTILICRPYTRFTLAASDGSLTYLNGHTYTYHTGDLLPHTTADLTTSAPDQIVKVFTFARQAGKSWTETWDGQDEDGATIGNDNYIYGIYAVDDSDNHSINSAGNDQPIWGNIPIDRTASQEAGDTVAPTVNTDSLTPAAGSIQASAVSAISCIVTDSAQAGLTASGFSVTSSTIMVTGPDGAVTGTKAFDSTTGVLSLTFATPITTDGTYTARVSPADNSGNSATDTTWTFSITITEAGSATTFIDSIKAYPNPAQGVPANINYTLNSAATMTLEIFTLLGELVYKKEWTKAGAGTYTETWALLNDSTDKVGTGVYIYRIKAVTAANSYKVAKKLVVIQ